MMKLATWNVNSVRTRVDAATQWLKEASPDVVVLQEIEMHRRSVPARGVRKPRL